MEIEMKCTNCKHCVLFNTMKAICLIAKTVITAADAKEGCLCSAFRPDPQRWEDVYFYDNDAMDGSEQKNDQSLPDEE